MNDVIGTFDKLAVVVLHASISQPVSCFILTGARDVASSGFKWGQDVNSHHGAVFGRPQISGVENARNAHVRQV